MELDSGYGVGTGATNAMRGTRVGAAFSCWLATGGQQRAARPGHSGRGCAAPLSYGVVACGHLSC